MKTLLRGTAVALVLALSVGSSSAQSTLGPLSPNQMVDMEDARLAQLKYDLRLSVDQEKDWGTFSSALHEMSLKRADRLRQRDAERQAAKPAAAPPATTPGAAPPPAAPPAPNGPNTGKPQAAESPDFAADLRLDADDMTTRADEFRRFADAAAPLFASLNDRQRPQFLAFVDRVLIHDPAASAAGHTEHMIHGEEDTHENGFAASAPGHEPHDYRSRGFEPHDYPHRDFTERGEGDHEGMRPRGPYGGSRGEGFRGEGPRGEGPRGDGPRGEMEPHGGRPPMGYGYRGSFEFEPRRPFHHFSGCHEPGAWDAHEDDGWHGRMRRPY